MICRRFQIENASGLHLRPASLLASALSGWESRAVILYEGREFNAKSPVQLLAACIKPGRPVELRIEGPDEAGAMEAADALIRAGLD